MNLKAYIYKAIFDSLDELIAVIDEDGDIVATNETWQKSAMEKGLIEKAHCIGYNYIKLCEGVKGEDRETALEIADGIKRVIAGELSVFKKIYSFVDPEGRENYYIFTIVPIKGTQPKLFVITHEEIAVSKEELSRKKPKKEAKSFEDTEVSSEESTLKELLKLLDALEGEVKNEETKQVISRLKGLLYGKKEPRKNPFLELSPKEAQIALLVKEGYSSKEIARILNLSKDSIDFYRKRIRKKLGLKGKGMSLKHFLEKISA